MRLADGTDFGNTESLVRDGSTKKTTLRLHSGSIHRSRRTRSVSTTLAKLNINSSELKIEISVSQVLDWQTRVKESSQF
jgi:hypothetical protein